MKNSTKIVIAAALAVAAYMASTRETPHQKEARHLKRGNELFQQNQFDKARVEYRNAAKYVPIDPEISYRWGLVDEAQGDIRNAYANFMLGEQQDPHYAPALLKIAHYKLVMEQYADVQKRIDIVLADDPGNAEAHALNASLLMRKKEYDAAQKELDLAFAKDPANITAFSVLTGIYVVKGDMKKAEETVDEGIVSNPTDLSLLLLKVKMFEKPLNLEKINQTYQDIINLQPGDVQLRTLLVDIYLQGGKIDQAETALRNAVRDLSDNWDLKHRLITFLGKHKGVDAAEKEIQATMQAFPEHTELYFWLAELYLSFNEVDKAVALLEQIVAKESSDRQSLYARSSLARINFRKGNKELAQKLVQAVLAKAPTNAEALYVRASIAADESRYQNAVSDLRLIIRDNRKNKDALQLLAEVLLIQGYKDLAIETLSQVVEINPGHAPSQVRLAQMYNQNKDPEHAMKILNLVTHTDPGYPVAWESIARIAIEHKDMETARSAIARLENFKDQEMVATFLKGQISQANGETSDAKSTYAKIIEADPTSPLAERAVFEMVERHHTPAELTETVRYLTSLNTDSPYINTIIGETYMTLGKPELAAPAFDKAIAGKSQLPDPYLNRSKIHRDAGDIDKAIEHLKAAQKVNPNDIRADLILADIYIRQQKYLETIAIYEDVLKRYPELDMAANNMAAIIAEYAPNDTTALEKAAKAVERFATAKNAEFLDTLSWIYYRQGKYSQANTVMARNMALGQGITPEMHYHYAAILVKNNNKVKAKEEIELAKDKDISPELAKKIDELLKEF